MFADFIHWNKWGNFPKYDGPPSNIQHDSIDDFNIHFMNKTRNFYAKKTTPKVDTSIKKNNESLCEILTQIFPNSTLEKKFWHI